MLTTGSRSPIPSAHNASGRICSTTIKTAKPVSTIPATTRAVVSGKTISPTAANISIAMPSSNRSARITGAVTLNGVPATDFTMYGLRNSPALPGVITISIPTPNTRRLSRNVIGDPNRCKYQCQRSARPP